MKRIVLIFMLLAFPLVCFAQDACEEKDIISRITCYANMAKSKDDLTVCDKSSHQGVRYQCYAIFAEYKQDEAICEKIPVADREHQQLKDMCLSDIAKIKKDGRICDKMVTSSLRDDCYFIISQATGDTSLCAKIEAEDRRNWCNGVPTYVE